MQLSYSVLVCGIPPLGLMFARPSAQLVELYRDFKSSSLHSFLFVSHGRTGRIAHLSGVMWSASHVASTWATTARTRPVLDGLIRRGAAMLFSRALASGTSAFAGLTLVDTRQMPSVSQLTS